MTVKLKKINCKKKKKRIKKQRDIFEIKDVIECDIYPDNYYSPCLQEIQLLSQWEPIVIKAKNEMKVKHNNDIDMKNNNSNSSGDNSDSSGGSFIHSSSEDDYKPPVRTEQYMKKNKVKKKRRSKRLNMMKKHDDDNDEYCSESINVSAKKIKRKRR
eukprot:190116_1